MDIFSFIQILRLPEIQTLIDKIHRVKHVTFT